jgi:hypothetical protein
MPEKTAHSQGYHISFNSIECDVNARAVMTYNVGFS